jgi:4-deoxy-L-threo-5-hexosulose-uronate ketol-isomerase
MRTRLLADPVRFRTMTSMELREAFLVEGLFAPGELCLHYCEADRAVIGSAVPRGQGLRLAAYMELTADFFCPRR